MVPTIFKRAVYQTCGLTNYFVATALWQVVKGCENTYEKFLLALPPNGVLLDIGANLGVTVVFARKQRPDLTLVAFEPVPMNLDAAMRLCRLLCVNGTEFHSVALGDSVDSAEMVMPILGGLPRPGQTYVVNSDYDYSSAVGDKGIRFTVPVTTVDSFELPRVDGIKLDVENFEWHVLRGAKELLKRDHPLIYCELWDTPNRGKVMSLLGGYGYECQKLDTKEDFLFRWTAKA